jgi:glutamine synthetase
MKYSKDEVIQYTREEDVKFIRLTFCDVFGKQKNIAIMPEELPGPLNTAFPLTPPPSRASGMRAAATCFCTGAGNAYASSLAAGARRVVQMFSGITHNRTGRPLPAIPQSLKRAVEEAKEAGLSFPSARSRSFTCSGWTKTESPQHPLRRGGYMDIAPEDRGRNIRREICLTLEQMGIRPGDSHHEEGPGQMRLTFGSPTR